MWRSGVGLEQGGAGGRGVVIGDCGRGWGWGGVMGCGVWVRRDDGGMQCMCGSGWECEGGSECVCMSGGVGVGERVCVDVTAVSVW